MVAQNLACVIALVTWGMRSSWAETIWSINVLAPGLVSEVFLINPPERLPLILHGLLWDFSNSQATLGGSFPTLWILLGIIPFFDHLRGYLKEKNPAYGAKPGAPSRLIPKSPRLTIDWPYPPSLARLIPYIYPPPPSWWGFGMGSWSEL